jgi:hypothetical protein
MGPGIRIDAGKTGEREASSGAAEAAAEETEPAPEPATA